MSGEEKRPEKHIPPRAATPEERAEMAHRLEIDRLNRAVDAEQAARETRASYAAQASAKKRPEPGRVRWVKVGGGWVIHPDDLKVRR